jgi:hypothetical protein
MTIFKRLWRSPLLMFRLSFPSLTMGVSMWQANSLESIQNGAQPDSRQR